MRQYLLNNAIAFDQQVNALLGGSPDETLSSRAFRAERRGRWFGRVFRPLIDMLFFWQDGHCAQAYLAELQRRQMPLEFQQL